MCFPNEGSRIGSDGVHFEEALDETFNRTTESIIFSTLFLSGIRGILCLLQTYPVYFFYLAFEILNISHVVVILIF